jgi:hypothetical protein
MRRRAAARRRRLEWLKAHKAALDALPDDVRNKGVGIMKEQKQCYDRLMKDE